MKISLSSSLHLNHGAVTPDMGGGDALPMLSFVPVGLLSLKAYADQQDLGAQIRVTELNTLINAGKIPNDDGFYDHVVDAILEDDDDFVGLMTDADSLHHTLITAERVKRRRPAAKVCLGGPASSPMAAQLLDTFPFLDYVVRSEGEETFAELIAHLQGKREARDILGLSWRDGGKGVDNAPRTMADDLDLLPIPDFAAYDMSSGAALYLDVGRGCPFKCSFCATAPFWKRQYRMKSIERIVREAVLIRDTYGRHQINFSHDIFTCNRAWTLQFCDHLIEHPLGIAWTCSTRTDIIDPEVLERMAAAGCVEIYYGIESGSPEIQRTIEKGLDLDWSRKIVETTARVGIRPVTGFILGYPFESYQTLGDTLKRFFEYLEVGGYRAHLFTLSPFPESPMFRQFGVPHLDRPAEYYELPLTQTALAPSMTMKRDMPHIFASTYRYKTPELPARLVDASEEVSARMSMLRSLWPHLLHRYPSPLDFYQRWVDWIEPYNDRRRPGTFFRHQAEADDLLEFVTQEMERLGIAGGALPDLVRYEKMKLDGRYLASPIRVGVPSAQAADTAPAADVPQAPHAPEGAAGFSGIGPNTVLQQNAGFLASEFDHDIQALLARRPAGESLANGRRWVVVYKTSDEQLTTIQVGSWVKRLLERAAHPVRVQELLGGDAAPAAAQEASSAPDPGKALEALQMLIRIGLLREVQPS
jgi:radical SAM superfamily enzyme YgiQ (UPF0313 family)